MENNPESTAPAVQPSRADFCTIACARMFARDGEVLISPMAAIPRLAARVAKACMQPSLVLSEEASLPYRRVFDVVWMGRRHVMMGASQVDRFGNQNISCIGPHGQPKVQLLGVRGAPGNTINHATSYWVPRHSSRVFVPAVSMVSGIGTDRAATLGKSGRFVDLRGVVSNLGAFDFAGEGGVMRAVSLHPGVTAEEVRDNTGFDVEIAADVPTTEPPTDLQLTWIAHFDAAGSLYTQVPG